MLRDGAFVTLPSTRLVPGDVVALKPCMLPCDLVLLSGECIVDENMLTGGWVGGCRGGHGWMFEGGDEGGGGGASVGCIVSPPLL